MNVITRLNCSNCKFVAKAAELVKKGELNTQGGIKDATPAEKDRARKVKLITLPGKMKVTEKHWCDNDEVEQWVTEHMWCRRWEATGTIHQK